MFPFHVILLLLRNLLTCSFVGRLYQFINVNSRFSNSVQWNANLLFSLFTWEIYNFLTDNVKYRVSWGCVRKYLSSSIETINISAHYSHFMFSFPYFFHEQDQEKKSLYMVEKHDILAICGALKSYTSSAKTMAERWIMSGEKGCRGSCHEGMMSILSKVPSSFCSY